MMNIELGFLREADTKGGLETMETNNSNIPITEYNGVAMTAYR